MTKRKQVIPGMSEAQVSRAVEQAFRNFGIEPIRQNAGGMLNAKGQYVPMAPSGSSDWHGVFPLPFGIAAGKAWACEVKKEDFDPAKVRGKELTRFLKQVAKLREVNTAGGYGWWSRHPADVIYVLGKIRDGWRIVIDEDNNCWVDDGS